MTNQTQSQRGAGRLAGKVALVTGAGSGFGAEIARRFAVEGAQVALLDLRLDAAQAVADEIGAQALAIEGNVAQPEDVSNAVEAVMKRFGRLDVLVNNAGITHINQPLLDTSEEMFDRVFDVNVKSIFLFVKATVPLMRANGGGVILNVGSTAGLRPRPGLTWYNASKGAVNLMSKSLAVELASDGIRVNALCPVAGNTPLLAYLMGVPDTPENRQK